MKNLFYLILLSLPSLSWSQVLLNQIDDFEDYTTGNWTKSTNVLPNQNITTGGPQGENDNFLRIQSAAGGQLLTFNNAQWLGNYYMNNGANKITYISMDVRNSGTNIIFLRLAFIDANWTNPDPIWCSTNAIAVLPGEGWKKINFPISESSLTDVNNIGISYSGVFNSITEVRILHNDAPAWESDPIEAILDIDNIMARNSPLLGIDEVVESKSITNLHPNPANNHFTLYNKNNLSENFNYKIIDMTGRIIAKGDSKFNEQINIEGLSSGTYLIHLETEKGEFLSKKIIKN